MKFIQDYLNYNSGNECPLNYHRWCALFLLASTLGKKVYCTQSTDDAYYKLYPNLYIGLVGKQGSRKSTAKGIARDIFREANPDSPCAASVQSCQDIIKTMSADDSCRTFTDETGTLREVRPYTFFINELKNFLSINPTQMLDFLTDIYDSEYFDCSTIKHGAQAIENPCLNILACETPKWIIDKLKLNIISGGFSRRMIYVYELDKRVRISFPNVTKDMKEARLRCVKHLQGLTRFVGKFTWSIDARAWYHNWYQGLITPQDEVMEGYYESKHIQMLKVAMSMAAAQEKPSLVFTPEIFQSAVALLDVTEVNMPKLSVASGRNELALPQQDLLDLLDKAGGEMAEMELKRLTQKSLSPMEQFSVLKHLSDTGQIYKIQCPDTKGVTRWYYMTELGYAKSIKQGRIKKV